MQHPDSYELSSDAAAIKHLKKAVADGQNWYTALLEAIRLWRSPEEEYNGERYIYLISGQAFDWLRLAERLCEEIKDLVPEEQIINLLFFEQPPVRLSQQEFKDLIGPAKFRAYLNYLYGVLIEQALILASIYEERKMSIIPLKPGDEVEKAYRRIYGAGQVELLDLFRREKRYARLKSMGLTEMKEFTYWLFKYRVNRCEKSKVASDTRKALNFMYGKLSRRRI